MHLLLCSTPSSLRLLRISALGKKKKNTVTENLKFKKCSSIFRRQLGSGNNTQAHTLSVANLKKYSLNNSQSTINPLHLTKITNRSEQKMRAWSYI